MKSKKPKDYLGSVIRVFIPGHGFIDGLVFKTQPTRPQLKCLLISDKNFGTKWEYDYFTAETEYDIVILSS